MMSNVLGVEVVGGGGGYVQHVESSGNRHGLHMIIILFIFTHKSWSNVTTNIKDLLVGVIIVIMIILL